MKVELMIDWVKNNHPEAIRFNMNDSDRKSIKLYLTVNSEGTYGTMIMMYGIIFYLACLQYMIEVENYEICKTMLSAIEILNANYDTKLPTKFYSKWMAQNIDLTPSQILDKHFKLTK